MAPIKAVQVKICGLTNHEDALWAVNNGADYIGVNFCAESPRKVSIERAAEIIQALPSFVKSVGVFVNPEPGELEKVLKKVPLHILQLHGEETPDQLVQIKTQFKVPIWKAIRVANGDAINKIPEFAGIVDIILLDAHSAEKNGGTGESFDWDLAVSAKQHGIHIFLAGGLNPDNVLDAIHKVEPWGVDVATGVEKDGHPKKKDGNKMKVFIQRAKGLMK